MSANVMALDLVIGSIMGNGVEMGPQRRGGAASGVRTDLTLDFRVVTVGNQTWAWSRLQPVAPMGDVWASQLRWIEATPFTAAMEMRLTGRAAGGVTFTTAPVRNAAINPVPISFFKAVGGNFYETREDFTYNRTLANSADPTDTQAPVLAPVVVVSQTPTSMVVTLSATDNSGHFFFLIRDIANDFVHVAFTNTATVPLLPATQHHFRVYAIDFSGNVSNVQTFSNEFVEPVFFTQGTARTLNFTLDSYTNPNALVMNFTSTPLVADAFVQIAVGGNWISGTGHLGRREWKPTINVDVGTREWSLTIPAGEIPGWAPGAILQFNMGYITHPVGGWGHYVLENYTVTAGPHNGSLILHRVGTRPGGVNVGELEVNAMTIYQAGNMIVINSEVEITSAVMHTISGQQVAVALNGNQIDISALASGVYLLQVNGTNVFRVVVR